MQLLRKPLPCPLERGSSPARRLAQSIALGLSGKAGRPVRLQETTMALPATYSDLDLRGTFALSSPTRAIQTPIALPGDVHTALLAAGHIPDPYYGENEKTVMWVNETAWAVERSFTASATDIDGYLTLTLAEVDCIATILLNGEVVARTENSFIRNDIDVTGKVRAGENTLRIEFDIAPDVARARAD